MLNIKPSHDRLTQLLRYNTDRRVLLAALPVVSSWCPGVWQVPHLKKLKIKKLKKNIRKIQFFC